MFLLHERTRTQAVHGSVLRQGNLEVGGFKNACLQVLKCTWLGLNQGGRCRVPGCPTYHRTSGVPSGCFPGP
jgi:hypothetical protein